MDQEEFNATVNLFFGIGFFLFVFWLILRDSSAEDRHRRYMELMTFEDRRPEEVKKTSRLSRKRES